MRKITINNFRCYEKKSIEFRRGINLLIGDNSVGKTSLLRACNLVMNAFFCGYSDENTKWKSAEDDDFREIKNDDVVTDDLPVNIAFELDEIDCPDIILEDGSVVPLHRQMPLAEEFGYPEFNIEKKSKKLLVRTYGVYWKRENVNWGEPQLLGQQLNGSPVDFGDMRGLYVLYDNREPIFVGQAISEGLLSKLKTHTQDRLANRWNRFSWFGIHGVNQNGSIHKVKTFNVTITDVANALEAVLVEGLEPRQNRCNYDYFNGFEYSQYE